MLPRERACETRSVRPYGWWRGRSKTGEGRGDRACLLPAIFASFAPARMHISRPLRAPKSQPRNGIPRIARDQGEAPPRLRSPRSCSRPASRPRSGSILSSPPAIPCSNLSASIIRPISLRVSRVCALGSRLSPSHACLVSGFVMFRQLSTLIGFRQLPSRRSGSERVCVIKPPCHTHAYPILSERDTQGLCVPRVAGVGQDQRRKVGLRRPPPLQASPYLRPRKNGTYFRVPPK